MDLSKYLGSLDRYATDQRSKFEDILAAIVEVPTVSMDPEHKQDIRKGAELARQYLESFGAKAELHETSGYPVVYGRFTMPGAKKTVTIYNHIDVQPAQEPQWTREPFVFAK